MRTTSWLRDGGGTGFEHVLYSSCNEAYPGVVPAYNQEAKMLLKKLAHDEAVQRVLEKKAFRIENLKELSAADQRRRNPRTQCVGWNVSRGTEEIAIALRDDSGVRMRSYDLDETKIKGEGERDEDCYSVIGIFLHELAHMNCSDHDEEFYAEMKEIRKLYVKFKRGGFLGGVGKAQDFFSSLFPALQRTWSELNGPISVLDNPRDRLLKDMVRYGWPVLLALVAAYLVLDAITPDVSDTAIFSEFDALDREHGFGFLKQKSDKLLTFDEFEHYFMRANFRKAYMGWLFDLFDQNRDNHLTQAEFRKFHAFQNSIIGRCLSRVSVLGFVVLSCATYAVHELRQSCQTPEAKRLRNLIALEGRLPAQQAGGN